MSFKTLLAWMFPLMGFYHIKLLFIIGVSSLWIITEATLQWRFLKPYKDFLTCNTHSQVKLNPNRKRTRLVVGDSLHYTCTQCTFRYAPRRESHFFDQEGCYWAVVVMAGPFGSPLGVLWLNGIADCLLQGFLTSGLVSRAPKGWLLGIMAPFPSCAFW